MGPRGLLDRKPPHSQGPRAATPSIPQQPFSPPCSYPSTCPLPHFIPSDDLTPLQGQQRAVLQTSLHLCPVCARATSPGPLSLNPLLCCNHSLQGLPNLPGSPFPQDWGFSGCRTFSANIRKDLGKLGCLVTPPLPAACLPPSSFTGLRPSLGLVLPSYHPQSCPTFSFSPRLSRTDRLHSASRGLTFC